MKRAQAALEYMTTYGWAFLMMTIALGTLFYFGLYRLSSKVLL